MTAGAAAVACAGHAKSGGTPGDDNVAIKAGGAGPATHLTIAHNHFYARHGMSIGSGTDGGVNHVRVSDLTIDGADNGIRIKSDWSRGGLVQDVSYENVCMRNVRNPIVLTTRYTTFDGNKLPDYRDIALKNVHRVTPGWLTLMGLDAQHRIEGNVDFIFGDGNAVFEGCEIHSTPHATGYITAQGKGSAGQDSGFVFERCKLTAAPGVANVWLGRPWRPYANVIFMDTEMGAHIEAAGWREWHPGETHYMDTVSYAEFQNSGPGAHSTERDAHTKVLTAADAAAYQARRFLAGGDGWDPTARRK